MDIPAWLMTTVSPLSALVGILVMIGLAVIKGRLIPESTFQRFMDARDREVDTLKHALEISQAQVSALTDTAETANALLVSLRGAPDEDSGE